MENKVLFIRMLLLSLLLPIKVELTNGFESTTTALIPSKKLCSDLAPSNCKLSLASKDFNVDGKMLTLVNELTCQTYEFNNRTLDDFIKFNKYCFSSSNFLTDLHSLFTIAIKSSSRWSIINDSFTFFKVQEFIAFKSIKLVNFKGFDIESQITIGLFELAPVFIVLQMDLNLYKRSRLVKSCEDFENSKSREFIFRSNENLFIGGIKIVRPNMKYPICSLFFRSAQLGSINLAYVANSYHMKNQLTFSHPNNLPLTADLNTLILNFIIEESYNIDLETKLMHPGIFLRMVYFTMNGHFNSIETELFKNFKQLKFIYFYVDPFRQVIRKQGIEWINYINSHIDVDYMNRGEIIYHREDFVNVILTNSREFYSDRQNHFFYDKDFCLFHKFPFRQLIFIRMGLNEDTLKYRNKTSFTCTELFLSQYYLDHEALISPFVIYKNLKLKASNFTACGFDRRLKLCNKSNLSFSPAKSGTLTSFDVLVVFEIILILLGPLQSSFGIVTNCLTIFVILNKKNKETMRENHYIYMSLHCFSNLIIFISQLMSLMSECQYPFGFFCSSIKSFVGVQYIKIIFGEYLNNLFRLMSNFTYLGFSLCRLSKIGTQHNKLTVFISELKIKKFMIGAFLFSASMSISKAIQYRINLVNIDVSYPITFSSMIGGWQNKSGFIAIFVLNIIYNILNYFLFVFVHLVVDCILIKTLWQVMRERVNKMKEMKRSVKEIENVSKENEESKRRAIFMVIINSTLNFCTKIPLMIMSVNDLRILIQRPFFELENEDPLTIKIFNNYEKFETAYSFKYFCWTQHSCQVIQSFGNCLFLFSTTTVLFFLKHFDKNFKLAFSECFSNKKR